MESLIQNLPNIISSVDNSALNVYNFSFDTATIAFMKHNFSTIDRMAVGFDYSSKFDDFAETLSNPMSISSFLNKVKKEDVLVADYLEKVIRTFKIDKSTTSIVDLVWMANITNSLGEQDAKMEMLLSDLLFSLQHSSAYKNVSPMEVRSRILEKFQNDVDEHLAEEYFGMDASKAQTYLGVAYTENSNTKDNSKWYDYATFDEIAYFDEVEIKNEDEFKKSLISPSTSTCKAGINYIKTNYLSSTDPNLPSYCDDELEREYKATVIYSLLAEMYNVGEVDENDNIGFNLLARIKNIPELIAEKNPLAKLTNLINNYEDEAVAVLHQDILKDQPTAEDEQEKSNTLSAEEYTKKQLATFNKFVDKKRIEVVSTLDFLVKTKTTKTNLKKIEARLSAVATEYGISLVSPSEEKNVKARIDANIDLLIPAVNKRFDELGRAKEVFKVVKRKKGTNLDLDAVEFDRGFLGKSFNVLTPYQESIIRGFYKIIKTDPILKTNAVYRRTTPTFTMARINERVEKNGAEPEISSVFSAFTMTEAKTRAYEEDKILEEKFIEENEEISLS